MQNFYWPVTVTVIVTVVVTVIVIVIVIVIFFVIVIVVVTVTDTHMSVLRRSWVQILLEPQNFFWALFVTA